MLHTNVARLSIQMNWMQCGKLLTGRVSLSPSQLGSRSGGCLLVFAKSSSGGTVSLMVLGSSGLFANRGREPEWFIMKSTVRGQGYGTLKTPPLSWEQDNPSVLFQKWVCAPLVLALRDLSSGLVLSVRQCTAWLCVSVLFLLPTFHGPSKALLCPQSL